MAGGQYPGIIEARTDNLQPHGQAIAGEPQGHRQGWLAGQVEGVGKGRPGGPAGAGPVHRYLPVGVKGIKGQGRCDQQIVLGVKQGHAFTDRHAFIHGTQIIQHGQFLCLSGHFHQCRIHQVALAFAQVAHGVGGTAVEQVAEGGQRVAEARVRLGHDGAQCLEYLAGFEDRFLDVRIHIHIAQCRAQGDAQAFHGLVQGGQIIGVAARCRQAIAGIRFGEHLHHQRCVGHGAGHGAGVSQSAEGAGWPVGDFTEGGLVPDDTAKRRGNTDGATRIGPQGHRRHAR